MDDDLSEETDGEWTLADVWMTGGEEERREIEDLVQDHIDELVRDVDQDQLKRVRSGGHQVRAFDRDGACEFQISIYRPGPRYGFWSLSHSPEGHEVRIEHCLPMAYRPDGGFDVLTSHERWTIPAFAWRKSPESFIKDLMGKMVAREVAPLLRLLDAPSYPA